MKSRLFWKIAQQFSFHVDAVQALAKVATEVYLPEQAWTLRPSLVQIPWTSWSRLCLHQEKAKDHPLS